MTMRRECFAIAAFAIAALPFDRASAALYLYEPFNYTAGPGLAGIDGQIGNGGNAGNTATSVLAPPQGGSGSPFGQQAANGNYWMSAGNNNNNPYTQASDAVTNVTDLSYSGLADPTTGGSIQLGGGGSTPRLAFTPTTNSGDGSTVSVYYSLLVRINDMFATQGIGGLIGGFNNTRGSQGNNPSTVGAALYAKKVNDGANFVFGVAEQSTNASFATYDTTELNFGQTYLVVGKYNINGTLNVGGTTPTSDDTAQIWINPTSLGGGDPAGSLITTINNIDIPTNQTDAAGGNPTVQTFIFRQDGTIGANAPTDYLVDDLRVGTTFADVTPVPSVGQPGDHNGDGIIDAADYVAWRKLNIDGPQGYTAFYENFGEGSAGSGRSPVPEPTAFAWLLFLGAWSAPTCRSRVSYLFNLLR